MLSSLLSLGSFALGVAVFFLFPLVQGGILGQVRDRLETPHQSPGPFAAYGRAYYGRLLGSLGLFTLLGFIIALPIMCLTFAVVLQVELLGVEAPAAPPPDAQQFLLKLLAHPATWVGIAMLMLVAAAVGMVYWVANCMLVCTRAGVFACWRQSLRFVRWNCAAWIAVCLLIVAVSAAITPVGLATQLGWVTNPWAAAAVALGYAALIGYTGVLFAGVVMSLYLSRRTATGHPVVPEG